MLWFFEESFLGKMLQIFRPAQWQNDENTLKYFWARRRLSKIKKYIIPFILMEKCRVVKTFWSLRIRKSYFLNLKFVPNFFLVKRNVVWKRRLKTIFIYFGTPYFASTASKIWLGIDNWFRDMVFKNCLFTPIVVQVHLQASLIFLFSTT